MVSQSLRIIAQRGRLGASPDRVARPIGRWATGAVPTPCRPACSPIGLHTKRHKHSKIDTQPAPWAPLHRRTGALENALEYYNKYSYPRLTGKRKHPIRLINHCSAVTRPEYP